MMQVHHRYRVELRDPIMRESLPRDAPPDPDPGTFGKKKAFFFFFHFIVEIVVFASKCARVCTFVVGALIVLNFSRSSMASSSRSRRLKESSNSSISTVPLLSQSTCSKSLKRSSSDASLGGILRSFRTAVRNSSKSKVPSWFLSNDPDNVVSRP